MTRYVLGSAVGRPGGMDGDRSSDELTGASRAERAHGPALPPDRQGWASCSIAVVALGQDVLEQVLAYSTITQYGARPHRA